MLDRDPAFLWDILEAAQRASGYTQGMTFAEFSADRAKQDAVAYQVQIIGEAASRLSEEFRWAHQEIPWSEMIGMRHKIVHNYREIRRDILWSTATESAPELIRLIEPLIPPLPQEG